MLYSHAYILMYTSMDSSTTYFLFLFFPLLQIWNYSTIGLRFSNLVTLGLPEDVTHDALIWSL